MFMHHTPTSRASIYVGGINLGVSKQPSQIALRGCLQINCNLIGLELQQVCLSWRHSSICKHESSSSGIVCPRKTFYSVHLETTMDCQQQPSTAPTTAFFNISFRVVVSVCTFVCSCVCVCVCVWVRVCSLTCWWPTAWQSSLWGTFPVGSGSWRQWRSEGESPETQTHQQQTCCHWNLKSVV